MSLSGHLEPKMSNWKYLEEDHQFIVGSLLGSIDLPFSNVFANLVPARVPVGCVDTSTS